MAGRRPQIQQQMKADSISMRLKILSGLTTIPFRLFSSIVYLVHSSHIYLIVDSRRSPDGLNCQNKRRFINHNEKTNSYHSKPPFPISTGYPDVLVLKDHGGERCMKGLIDVRLVKNLRYEKLAGIYNEEIK
jgi:hypothetical protein